MRTVLRVIKSFFIWLFTIIILIPFFIFLIATVYTTTLTQTVANPAFLAKEIEKAGVYSLAKEELDKRIEDLVPGLGEMQVYQVIRDSISEEWLSGEVKNAFGQVTDYLTRKTDTLEFSFATAGFKTSMKAHLRSSIQTSPPAGLQGLTAAQLEPYLQSADAGIDQLLPATITVALENTAGLEPLRDMFKAVHSIPTLLVMVTAILALFLVFLHFSIKGAFRVLGTPLFTAGVLCYAINTVAIRLAPGRLSGMDLPSSITVNTVIQIARDVLAPANTYAIIIGAVGLVLIIASFFFGKKKEKKAKKKQVQAASA